MILPEGLQQIGVLSRRGTCEVLHAARPDGRAVVIKRLRPELADDPDARDAFEDEAAILAGLEHPNVARLLGRGVQDGLPYQIHEYLEGVDLAELLERQGPLTELEARYVMLRVARALSYVHAARDREGRPLSLVHRDVSPDNVLVGAGGGVRLTDFGIARARARLVRTAVGRAKGKLSFMAPEQMRGEPVSASADVFSFGCTLVAAIAGASPLATEHARREVMAGQPLRSAGLGPGLAAIVDRCLEQRPERRPSAEEVAAGLTQLEGVAPSRAPAVPERRVTRVLARPPTVPPPSSDSDERPTEVATAPGVAPVPATPEVVDPEGIGPGAWIGEYQIVRRLGRGGFGEVFEVQHVALGGPFALKRLHPSGRLRRFAREIEALERLDHPRVVRLIAHGTTEDGDPFMVMERLRGRPLSTILHTEGALDPATAARLLGDVAEGLAAVHAAGLVHRDVSPANIMVVPSPTGPRGVLMDLGLALLDPGGERSRVTAPGMRLGTIFFMAPEQAQDSHAVGPAADVFALATTLYVSLSGLLPTEATPEAVLAWLQHPRRPPWPESGRDPEEARLGALLQEAWGHDPQARPDARALAERLGDLAERLDPATAPPRPVSLVLQSLLQESMEWLDTAPTVAPPGRGPGFEAPPEPTATVQVPAPGGPRGPGFGALAAVVIALGLLLGIGVSRLGSGPEPEAPAPGRIVDRPEPAAAPAAAPVARPAAPAAAAPPEAAPPPGRRAPPRRAPAPATEPRPPSPPPQAPAAPSVRVTRARVARALRARGLTVADARADPTLAPAWRTWADSEGRGPVARARAADGLRRALDAVTLDAGHLRRRLTTVERVLTRAAARHPAATLRPLERRYLDLVGDVKAGCAPVACRTLGRAIEQLRIELTALTSG